MPRADRLPAIDSVRVPWQEKVRSVPRIGRLPAIDSVREPWQEKVRSVPRGSCRRSGKPHLRQRNSRGLKFCTRVNALAHLAELIMDAKGSNVWAATGRRATPAP